MTAPVFPILVAAMLAFAVPAVETPENIGCMDGGYLRDQQMVLERFSKTANIAEFAHHGLPADLVDILRLRADACAESYDWPAEGIEMAGRYKLAQLILHAAESRSTFAKSQWQGLHDAYEGVDKDAVLEAVFGIRQQGSAGQSGQLNNRQIEDIMVEARIPGAGSNIELVTAWLAARAVRDTSLSYFRNVELKE